MVRLWDNEREAHRERNCGWAANIAKDVISPRRKTCMMLLKEAWTTLYVHPAPAPQLVYCVSLPRVTTPGLHQTPSSSSLLRDKPD